MDKSTIDNMNTEEKLNALKVISKEKDKVDAHILELEGIAPNRLNFIEVNHNNQSIMLTDKASREIYHLLTAMLQEQKMLLIEKAKELMA